MVRRIRDVIGPSGPVTDVVVARPAREVSSVSEIDEYHSHRVKVLFDTGAEVSLVQTGVASSLGLTPVGHEIVRGIYQNKPRKCDIFDVDVLFEKGRRLLWRLPNVPVAEVHFASLDEDIRIVLGRSAMWGGVFTYNAHPSKMIFTFEPPRPDIREPGI